jgi:hypothetical protein
MNNTLCSAFWNHTNIRSGDRVFPCCRFKQPVQSFNGNVDDILHSVEYHKLRQESLNGVLNPNCEKCYYEEKNGKERKYKNWKNGETENYIRRTDLRITCTVLEWTGAFEKI